MHNNRGYHQEVMFVTTMAARANRDVSRAGIGTKLIEPNVDYADHGEGLWHARHRTHYRS